MRTNYQQWQGIKANSLKQSKKCLREEPSHAKAKRHGLNMFLMVLFFIAPIIMGGCSPHHRSMTSNGRLPDDRIVGQWETVDFVQHFEDFILGKKHWSNDFYLKGLTFFENGTTSGPWVWTNGWLIHPGDHTAARYVIVDTEGTPTLFMQWISGDVTMRSLEPWYYVLVQTHSSAASAEQVESVPVILSDLPKKDIVLHRARCTAAYVQSAMGTPSRIDNDGRMLRYTDAGIDFWFSQNGPLSEIHLNKGCRAHLDSGISLASTKQDVFSVYGEPVRMIDTDNLHRKNDEGILYRKGNTSRIYYGRDGLIFWFRDNAINQIVVFKGRLTAEE